jgi:hypothetical protein
MDLNAVDAWAHSEDKLLVRFPLRMASPLVTTDAPFDIYEPAKPDFQALGWVHLVEGAQGVGVTISCDRATSYFLQRGAGGTNIGAVLAYGGAFEYAPDKSAPLRGKASYRMSLSTEDSHVVAEHHNALRGSVVASTDDLPPSPAAPERSFLELSVGETTLEAAYVENGNLLVRLFNASANPATTQILLDASLVGKPAHEVKLDGTELRTVDVNGSTISLAMSPFEVKTLKIDLEGDAGQ